VEARVWVGAAQRFMQGRDQVVVFFARFVIEQRAVLQRAFDGRSGDDSLAGFFWQRGIRRQFQRVEGGARVAVGADSQETQGVGLHAGLEPLQPTFSVGQRALDDGFDVLIGESAQREDARAREQRGVDLEAGVFGGRAYQRDDAALDMRQYGVLLSFIEPMNFVDEEDGALMV